MHQYTENLKHIKRKSKLLKKSTDITALIVQMKIQNLYRSSNDYALTKNMFIIGTRQFENKCTTAPSNLNPLDIM